MDGNINEKKNAVPYERWPENLKCKRFDELQVLDFENMPDEEYKKYESTIKAYRDIQNCLDTAWRKGFAEGMHKVKVKRARLMLADGLCVDKVAEFTGLSKDEIKQLKNNI